MFYRGKTFSNIYHIVVNVILKQLLFIYYKEMTTVDTNKVFLQSKPTFKDAEEESNFYIY